MPLVLFFAVIVYVTVIFFLLATNEFGSATIVMLLESICTGEPVNPRYILGDRFHVLLSGTGNVKFANIFPIEFVFMKRT